MRSGFSITVVTTKVSDKTSWFFQISHHFAMIVTYSLAVQCRFVAHWSVILEVIECKYDVLKRDKEDRVMTIVMYELCVVLRFCNNAIRLHIT